MKRFFETFRNAVVVGLVLAFLEFVLVYIADPAINHLTLIQSVFFWFSCGVLIYLSNFELSYTLKGILISILMNIPWYINLSLIPQNYSILLPLIIASIIFGAIGGFFSGRLKKTASAFNVKNNKNNRYLIKT